MKNRKNSAGINPSPHLCRRWPSAQPLYADGKVTPTMAVGPNLSTPTAFYVLDRLACQESTSTARQIAVGVANGRRHLAPFM